MKITDRGKRVLAEFVDKPDRLLDETYLMQFAEFRDFLNRRGTSSGNKPLAQSPETTGADGAAGTSQSDLTPDEALRSAYEEINKALGDELLAYIREASSDFFERLIIKLLLKMGYGSSEEEAGRNLSGSGDGGVDGVINQDPLGVDQIYVQAKCYAEGNNIGSGAIRAFAGALGQFRAQKGIFFTTSKFSKSAIDTAEKLNTRIILIDGEKLSDLMIQHNVGCREEETLALKKIDEDFFPNEE